MSIMLYHCKGILIKAPSRQGQTSVSSFARLCQVVSKDLR